MSDHRSTNRKLDDGSVWSSLEVETSVRALSLDDFVIIACKQGYCFPAGEKAILVFDFAASIGGEKDS